MAIKNILFFFLLFCIGGCASQKPFYNKKEKDWSSRIMPDTPLKYSVYLLGGFGEKKEFAPEVFNMLNLHREKADTNHITVFLNDDVTGNGIPPATNGR